MKHTDKSKEKISKGRKKYLNENPDSHPWKRKDKNISIPCEYLKNILLNNKIVFVEEFRPSKRLYRIDIAFPDKKLGIEVNGNQHYNKDGSLKDYYKDRNLFIKDLGWELLEIHYSLVYNDKIVNIINEFLKSKNIIYDFNYEEYLIEKLKKSEKIKCFDCDKSVSRNSIRCRSCNNIKLGEERRLNFKKCKCGNFIDERCNSCKDCKRLKEIKICSECSNECTGEKCKKCYSNGRRLVERPPIEKIIEEIEELGYSAVGRKYGVSDNSIRKWIKNYKKV